MNFLGANGQTANGPSVGPSDDAFRVTYNDGGFMPAGKSRKATGDDKEAAGAKKESAPGDENKNAS